MITGTYLLTWFMGKQIGQDEYGNCYYRGRNKKLWNRERRWVMFKGNIEASKVPPEWHAWLHHTVEKPLIKAVVRAADWQTKHLPNLTGTIYAVRRLSRNGRTDRVYKAWCPINQAGQE